MAVFMAVKVVTHNTSRRPILHSVIVLTKYFLKIEGGSFRGSIRGTIWQIKLSWNAKTYYRWVWHAQISWRKVSRVALKQRNLLRISHQLKNLHHGCFYGSESSDS